jgi:ATP-dependent protease ClpP protease subunit
MTTANGESPGTEHCLILTAAITPASANNLMSYLVDRHLMGASRVTVALSSPGGNVGAGITVFNVMRGLSYELVTHNIGNIDSIANVVFLGGGRRFVNETSTFMFHDVSFDSNANEKLEERLLLERLDVIKSERNRIASITAARSRLDLKACHALFRRQVNRNARWAVDNGIADGIEEFKIPAHGNVKYLT